MNEIKIFLTIEYLISLTNLKNQNQNLITLRYKNQLSG